MHSYVTDENSKEDTMKNKKIIALLAVTIAFSGVMSACSFGDGKDDSVVVESTPTPEPTKKAAVTPTVAADAQDTTYTSKDKSVSVKLPDATWANKSDETDMLSFESPDQGKILILHGAGDDMDSAIIPNSQDMAVSLAQADNMVNGTDFEIQDYTAKDVSGVNVYSYTVKYNDTTKSGGYVYSVNKYFVSDSEYYSIVASVKDEKALDKIKKSVESFKILSADSTLKAAAPESSKDSKSADGSTAGTDGTSTDGSAAGTDGASTDGSAAGTDGSTASDGTASDGSGSTDGTSTDSTASDGSSSTDNSSSDGSSDGVIVNGGFTDEELNNTDETRTIYRNSDGKPRVIVPDGNGEWMDNEGTRFTFSSQHDCDVYSEDGTSFYWHGEAADVYYMPVQ